MLLCVGEPPAPPVEALGLSEPVTERLPLVEGLCVSVCVGHWLLEGEPVADRLPLAVREKAEAEAEGVPPTPPPEVALGLTVRLLLPDASGVREAGEPDAEREPTEAVCDRDHAELGLMEAEPEVEALPEGERVQLTVAL